MLGLGKGGSPAAFKYDSTHPLAAEHKMLAAFLHEAGSRTHTNRDDRAGELDACTAMLDAKPEIRAGIVMAALERIDHNAPAFRKLKSYNAGNQIAALDERLHQAARILLRRKLPFSSEQVGKLLAWIDGDLKGRRECYFSWSFPAAGAVKAFTDFVKGGGDPSPFVATVKKIGDRTSKSPDRETRKYGDRLLAAAGVAPPLPIIPGEAWADAALEFFNGLEGESQGHWAELIAHCAGASGGKPNKKWQTTATALIESVADDAFANIADWFALVDQPRTQVIESWHEWQPDPNQLIVDENSDILKGLAWLCGVRGNDDMADAIGKMALSAYRKVPGVGPRASKVGNACVWALGQIPGDHSLAALAILKVRVKFKPAQKGIANALAAAAERAGMTPEELEEIGVPDYGMESVGLRTEQLGDYEANLRIVSAKKTELTWTNKDGKTLKTVPKAVRENHAEELKDIRQAAKDIVKMLSAQRDRIDNLHLAQRSWRYADFVSRYLEHPLVGTLGRRLIWSFELADGVSSGIWHDGKIVSADDSVIEDLEDETVVRLWHPVTDTTENVVAWREWFERHEVVQPFKQAHREIYLLTAAEETTEVYSNRYASHFVKQHQFNALCAARNWRNSLRLMVDDEYEPPTLELPDWDLRAEFWVEGVGEDYGTDTTESGSYLYLATDQVRFYRTEAGRNSAHAGGGGYHTYGTEDEINTPLPLKDIDPLVFSEVFRDVDLFVGVASVGNDPNWSDGGPEGRFIDYWQDYSFGKLSESAVTRREALERLVPRLKISDRLSIVDDKFLRVQGDVRAYKIHLGSGNILMEPNDQYLCIVAAQGKARQAGNVFLPFEGDNRLALILSKAFLLAEDTKIKDRTILSQIKF
ncbi:MAG: DUF4132 domain-containing protein [Woeseiaceae bacterium]|nr:DUF4132 domain-containing protein [Woeseiaceae bacterium]